MAKFRDSISSLEADAVVEERPPETPPPPPSASPSPGSGPKDRAIGDILRDLRDLSADQVERIVALQRERGIRFGEAAVQLGFVSTDDVLFALAQQFHYPVAPSDQRRTIPELVALNEPYSVQAEAFRALRSQVMMRVYAAGPASPTARGAVAIISPEAGDGKTYFAANLAVTLAQLGGRTLVVDADLRTPRLHEVFGVDNKTGLSGILIGRAESQVIKQVAGVPSLFVLPSGVTPPNPLELLERPAFGMLIRELILKFDHVIVDTAAASNGADASVTAVRCGTALVIARKDRSRVASLQDMVASLADSPVKLAGVVMNEF